MNIEDILVGARYSFPLSDTYGKRRAVAPTTRGVYVIRCADGRIYVGSTSGKSGFRGRLSRHLCFLRAGTHVNRALQKAYQDLGEQSFRCFVLEELEVPDVLVREQVYLDMLRPYEDGFNKARVAAAPMQGFKHSQASREKMCKVQKVRVKSQAELEGTSARSKELWRDSEFRSKIRAARVKTFQLMYDGVLHEGTHLSNFAKEHRVSQTGLSSVLSGQDKHHKGWYLPGHPSPWHSVLDPAGNEHRFTSTTGFSKQHGLQQSCLNRVVLGSALQHKGWTKAS